MYITLWWNDAAAGPNTEATIVQKVRARGFANDCTVRPGLIVANIARNFTRNEVQLLHGDLKTAFPGGQVSWLITVSPNAWDYIASPDVEATSRASLTSIVSYAT